MAIIIVDRACQVKFCFWDAPQDTAARELFADESRLIPSAEASILRKIDEFVSGLPAEPHTTLFDGTRGFRLSPLTGQHEEHFYAVIVETDQRFDSITRAAKRFHLTPRQAEVLSHVIEGASAAEIARSLSISEYTARGYIKMLLAKTGSRNRAAMVARVLSWSTSADERGAASAESLRPKPLAVGNAMRIDQVS